MQTIFLFIFSAVLLLTPYMMSAAETVPPTDSIPSGERGDKDDAAVSSDKEKVEQKQNVVVGSTESDPPPTAAEKETVGDDGTKKKKKALTPDPNRRWLMKQRDDKAKTIKPKAAKPLKWADSNQRDRCQVYEKEIAGAFEKARYYSIQGDRCKTAYYSDEFLKTAKKCQTGCPPTFLEYHGYGDLVLRNMQQLKALGTESCLGKTHQASDRPAGSAASKK
jgi:hypothetical protein